MTLMLASAGVAGGTLNKCIGADGKVTYTEQPCARNQSQATVKTPAPPPKGPGSDQRRSPGQVARCEHARKVVDSLKSEVANERHKNKTELLATAKQQIAEMERLIREQCS